MRELDPNEWVMVGAMPEAKGKIPRGTVLDLAEWTEAKESPVEPTAQSPEGTIMESAKQDLQKNVDGIMALGKAAGYAFVPGEENTLLKIGQYLETAYNEGHLGSDAWNFAKEAIMTPLRNLKTDIKPIVDEGIAKGTPQAAENIARRPFSFSLDVMSALGIGKMAASATKGGVSFAIGKSGKDISKRVAQAEKIGVARGAQALADDVADAFNTLDDKIKAAAETAKKTLPADAAAGFSVKEVTKLIDDATVRVGKPISDASENAIQALQKYKQRIQKVYKDKNVSPRELKEIIMDLDSDIDWNTAKSVKANSAIKALRKDTDVMLKTKFPAYEADMKPLAELMRVRDEASKALKVVRRNGMWEVPDTATGRIEGMFKRAPKAKMQEVLGKFAKETGLDIPGEMELSTFAKQFDAPTTHGARRAVMGGMAGFAVGGPKGAGVGSVLGGVFDKYGGIMAGKMIDISPNAFRALGAVQDAIPGAFSGVPFAAEAIERAGEEDAVTP